MARGLPSPAASEEERQPDVSARPAYPARRARSRHRLGDQRWPRRCQQTVQQFFDTF